MQAGLTKTSDSLNAAPKEPRAPTNAAWFDTADRCVYEAYRNGFVQSFIAHMAMLLILAVSVIRSAPPSPPVLVALDFTPRSDDSIDMGPVVDVLLADLLRGDAPEGPTNDIDLATYTPPADAISTDTMPIDVLGFDNAAESLPPDDVDLLAEVPSPQPARAATSALPGMAEFAHTSSGHSQRTGGGGIDGELGRRLQAAGAKTGDVQISIRWDNANDIDLHVKVEPIGKGAWSGINWTSRIGRCGGMLDVDANANSALLTPQPVENVFWGKGRAPYGRYTVWIHHYRNWAGQIRTPVEVAILVDGDVQRFDTQATFGASPTLVTSFVRPMTASR